MPRLPEALLLCSALIACDGASTDTTDPDTDVTTETEPPTDTEPPGDTDDTEIEGSRLRFTIYDFATKAPLEGVSYSGHGYTGVTDATGEFRIWVAPESDALVSLTADGYPRHDVYQWAGTGDSFYNNSLLSSATIAQLAGALQVEVDPTKSILSVSISEWDGDAPNSAFLAGVTISMDVAYDVALASDASSPFGVSPGTTTLADSSSEVTFVNVPAGEVTLTITPPEGYVCPYGQTTIEAIAGGVVNPAINCIPE